MVTRLRVVESHDPSLDRVMVETVGKWRFKPARLDGEPVQTCAREIFEFEPPN